mmetsp:Transcript_88888/g.231696  ORF Transcript_88888/g.231696 Transcript_88888/m.231696 type:complete len:539 (+) Transcript_88888:248-1864(+)
MHSALPLRGGGAELEPQLARVQLAAEFLHAPGSDVLHPVLKPLAEVGHVGPHGALVLDRARHALRHLDGGRAAEVAVVRALLHGLQRAHAAVALEPHAVVGEEILPWGLLCAGQHAAAHGGARPHAQGLHDVPWAADATVRDDGNAVPPRELRHVVHGGGLRPPARAHLLRGADRADAHAYAQGVNTAVDEVLGLPLRDHVATDHLEVRKLLLHPPDDVVLKMAVALAAVDDDSVHARIHQGPGPVAVAGAGADARSYAELALGVLGGEGELRALLQVRAGNEGDETTVLAHDGQLTLLGLVDNLVRGLRPNALPSSHQILEVRHDLARCYASPVLDEVRVPASDKAQQPRVHLSVVRHGEACEAARRRQLVDIRQQHRGLNADRVRNESALVFLYHAYLARLLLDRQVVVDDADAPFQCHADRHLVLGDGVHRAGDNRSLQLDHLREARFQNNFMNAEADLPGQADEVVVSEARLAAPVFEYLLAAVTIHHLGLRHGRPPRRTAAALGPCGNGLRVRRHSGRAPAACQIGEYQPSAR